MVQCVYARMFVQAYVRFVRCTGTCWRVCNETLRARVCLCACVRAYVCE
jgi:hypothetical protein